jgi:hypothetical protein
LEQGQIPEGLPPQLQQQVAQQADPKAMANLQQYLGGN